MSLNTPKCPKCGFRMIDKYCIKCGYIDTVALAANMDKYNEEISDLELYFKDSYLNILYGRNNKKIFILGPIYLSYRNNLLLGILFCNIEFFSSFYIARMFVALYIALYVFIFNIIILRILYMSFFDVIILNVSKIKIKKLSKRKNYREKLQKSNPNSIIKAILCIIIWIISISLFAYFY